MLVCIFWCWQEQLISIARRRKNFSIAAKDLLTRMFTDEERQGRCVVAYRKRVGATVIQREGLADENKLRVLQGKSYNAAFPKSADFGYVQQVSGAVKKVLRKSPRICILGDLISEARDWIVLTATSNYDWWSFFSFIVYWILAIFKGQLFNELKRRPSECHKPMTQPIPCTKGKRNLV